MPFRLAREPINQHNDEDRYGQQTSYTFVIVRYLGADVSGALR